MSKPVETVGVSDAVMVMMLVLLCNMCRIRDIAFDVSPKVSLRQGISLVVLPIG